MMSPESPESSSMDGGKERMLLSERLVPTFKSITLIEAWSDCAAMMEQKELPSSETKKVDKPPAVPPASD